MFKAQITNQITFCQKIFLSSKHWILFALLLEEHLEEQNKVVKACRKKMRFIFREGRNQTIFAFLLCKMS